MKPPGKELKSDNTFLSADDSMKKKSSTCGNSYRLTAGIITLACAALLVIAALVTPNPKGVGTHKQLGLTACGFYERTGYPCPTCGMTTAFAYMVRGQIYQAFAVQPAGALAALLCAVGVLTGAYVAITGRCLDRYTRRLSASRILWAAVAVVLGSWLWLCALTYFRSL